MSTISTTIITAMAAGRLTPDEYNAISEAMGGLEIANA